MLVMVEVIWFVKTLEGSSNHFHNIIKNLKIGKFLQYISSKQYLIHLISYSVPM